MTTALRAYHGDPAIKEKYLARVHAHAAADEIIHGSYWQNGKGCAVGCTIHGSSHYAYEIELGIPVELARLEDTLFEMQRNGKAKTFPERFLSAIEPGADLSPVLWKFLHWLLIEELANCDHSLVSAAVKQCADAIAPLTKGQAVDDNAVQAAWAVSVEAGARAVSMKAAARVARNKDSEVAWATAWAAIRAAIEAVEAVVRAEGGAASRAADAVSEALSRGVGTWPSWATTVVVVQEARETARSACCARMTDKLIQLLQEAEVKP
jgi:hypothetical protein